MTFLVAYASTHGHTARIAERLAGVLRDERIAVDVHDLRTAGAPSPCTTRP
jgi:menaquinone-dependent protoporphyrinogen IX oxidase